MKIDDGKVDYYNKSIIIDAVLYVYVASVYMFSYLENLNLLSNSIMAVLFGAIVYYLIFKCDGARVYFDKTLGFYTIFVAICIVSISYATYRDSASSMCQTLVLLWLVFFILYNYLVNTDNDKILIYAITISSVLYSAYVIGYYGISGYYELLISGERAGADITNVNTIGMISATGFSLCMYFAIFKKKVYLFLVSAVPLITAFGSGSRKALLVVVFSLLLLIFLKYKQNKSMSAFIKMIAWILIAIFVLKFLLSLPAFETIVKRFEGFINSLTGSGKTEGSAVIREKMIKYGFIEFKNHILLGHGINNSKIVTMKYLARATYLHNNFVELLFNVGVIGFSAYYAMFAYLLKKLYSLFKRKVEYAEILLIMLIIHLVMDYGMVAYYSKETYVLLLAAAVFVKLNDNRSGGNLNEQTVESGEKS